MNRSMTILFGVTNIQIRMHLRRWKSNEAVKQVTIQKSVFISQSHDIFTNLALEQWLHKNMDFTQHRVMMLWRNDPCVVIGQHQNPWVEANISELTKHGVKLARRHSGGGTVYHDLGNLNLTFFTTNRLYNRKNNFATISQALSKDFGLIASVSNRDDLMIRENYKISGSAARLTRTNSYHHCTLLLDVNKVVLRNVLQKKDLGIETTATKSIPSPVLNLKDEHPQINMMQLMSSIGSEFLRGSESNGFKNIDPLDGSYPELLTIRDDLTDWDWIYGKTPEFSANISIPMLSETVGNLTLSVVVERGKIRDINLKLPPGLSTGFKGDVQAWMPDIEKLKGQIFHENVIEDLKKILVQKDERQLNSHLNL